MDRKSLGRHETIFAVGRGWDYLRLSRTIDSSLESELSPSPTKNPADQGAEWGMTWRWAKPEPLLGPISNSATKSTGMTVYGTSSKRQGVLEDGGAH